jgi:hypothetical protein
MFAIRIVAGATGNQKEDEKGMKKLKPQEIKAAIAYFEEAVHESDEIISDCSPALQAELTEQKQHFVAVLEVLRRIDPENKPLTLERLRQMDGEPVWIKGSDAKTSGWALIKGKREKQIANCPDDWNISYYLKDYGKTWIAYPRKMEQEAAL